MEVVASHSEGRTAAAQCDLFTHKSVPVIFEPPCSTYFEFKFSVRHKVLYKIKQKGVNTVDLLIHAPISSLV